jgi:hypothetical protein
VSERASLERRYRRLLACYPAACRREHGDELVSVLIAGADDGRWRTGVAESLDLVRAGLWMRLRPPARAGLPRNVLTAVRLMYVGAALELAALITIVATTASLKATIIAHYPRLTAAQWHAELFGRLIPQEIAAAVATAVWLWLARANRRGSGWARIGFAAFFVLTTLGLRKGIALHAATYAPADLVAGFVLWLVSLATVVLIFSTSATPHYRRGHPSAQ